MHRDHRSAEGAWATRSRCRRPRSRQPQVVLPQIEGPDDGSASLLVDRTSGRAVRLPRPDSFWTPWSATGGPVECAQAPSLREAGGEEPDECEFGAALKAPMGTRAGLTTSEWRTGPIADAGPALLSCVERRLAVGTLRLSRLRSTGMAGALP